ncbi:MAG: acyl-CoA dehydrogenase, partial [Actinobacteria bacterium]|nr:acyl-CoA dehydrogenase [Actinomycetota bacterium]NIU64281.1 acyl-CoA dehydrogenase [Actinomycetota bacterium]NIW26088.1 acyl-CoA dehydrogenase [Actinomycetota bacterium]NIX18658.1 acyl-CoA dehydrogenase [Actinomycetota bacterium]
AGDHQREEFIDPLVRGEMTSCHCVTEPGAGSNMFDFKTNAVQRNGDWVLNGHKAFITNWKNADIMQVLTVTDPGKG